MPSCLLLIDLPVPVQTCNEACARVIRNCKHVLEHESLPHCDEVISFGPDDVARYPESNLSLQVSPEVKLLVECGSPVEGILFQYSRAAKLLFCRL